MSFRISQMTGRVRGAQVHRSFYDVEYIFKFIVSIELLILIARKFIKHIPQLSLLIYFMYCPYHRDDMAYGKAKNQCM